MPNQKTSVLDYSLTIEQVASLRSMHFWRMNQLKARNEGDQHEVIKSDKAIRLAMDRCDELQVTFKLQNQTLMAAEQRVPFSLIEKDINNELEINSLKIKVRIKPKDNELEIQR